MSASSTDGFTALESESAPSGVSHAYGYDNYKGYLKSWDWDGFNTTTPLLGEHHELTISQDWGRREDYETIRKTDYASGSFPSYDFDMGHFGSAKERFHKWWKMAPNEFSPTDAVHIAASNQVREITALDFGHDGSTDLTEIGYGARGNVDDVKIAALHSSQSSAREIIYVLTDRMGTPHVFLDDDGALLARVTTDPWGRGRTTYHTSETWRVPFTHHRNPGQVEEVALGLVEKGYRVMVPELGQYTGADPLHQAQVMTSWGPQAYAYAGGVPTGAARADLAALRAWFDERNPVAGKRIAARIKQKLALLRENPRMGRAVEGKPGVRELVVDDYVLPYVIEGE